MAFPRQRVATRRNGFRLFEQLSRPRHLSPFATGCARSAHKSSIQERLGTELDDLRNERLDDVVLGAEVESDLLGLIKREQSDMDGMNEHAGRVEEVVFADARDCFSLCASLLIHADDPLLVRSAAIVAASPSPRFSRRLL